MATQEASVWAVNLEALEQAIRLKLNLGPAQKTDTISDTNRTLLGLADSYLTGRTTSKLVLHVEPDRMHERLSIQQGLFLLPCDINSSFEDNLAAIFDINFDSTHSQQLSLTKNDINAQIIHKASVLKIIIPRRSIVSALNDLSAMNVTSATLFPGLDGFAKSLYKHLRPILRAPDDEFFDKFKTI